MCGRVSATTSMSIYNPAPLPSKVHCTSKWRVTWSVADSSVQHRRAAQKNLSCFSGPGSLCVSRSLCKVMCTVLGLSVGGSGQLVLVSFTWTKRLKCEKHLFLRLTFVPHRFNNAASLPPRCLLKEEDVYRHNIFGCAHTPYLFSHMALNI